MMPDGWCSFCHLPWLVTRDGKMYRHGKLGMKFYTEKNWEWECPGSGMKPAKVSIKKE